jgi:hypothetical protein
MLRAGKPPGDLNSVAYRGKICFSSPQSPSRPALVPTQPPFQCVPGASSPERQADHSPPPSSGVKKDGAILPLPHVSMAHVKNIKLSL